MRFWLQAGDQTISCEELKVSLYKDLLKSIYGDEPDIQIFVQTISDIFSKLTDKPASFFENLPIINLLSCIFQLRINSIGDRTNVNLNIDKTKRSLELRLDWVNEDLLDFNKKYVKKTIKIGSIEVEMDSPSANRLIEKTEEEYLYFVKSVKVKDKTLLLETNEEAKNITEKLSVKATLAIIEYYKEFVNSLNSLNFLNRYGIKEHTLNFIPSIESFLWFTKLIFNESLQAFYDNIFYLAKISNISPSYTENCTVGDYFVYIGILQRSLAQQSNVQHSSALHEEAVSDFPDEL